MLLQPQVGYRPLRPICPPTVAWPSDIHVVSGGSPNHRHLHGLWWYLGPQVLTQTTAATGPRTRSRHGSWWQPRPGHFHGLGWLYKLLISCSSPLSLRATFLHTNHSALLFLPPLYHILNFPISSSHILPFVVPLGVSWLPRASGTGWALGSPEVFLIHIFLSHPGYGIILLSFFALFM